MDVLFRHRRIFTFTFALLILTSPAAARPDEHQKKQLEIKTSEGSFKASSEPDPAHLRLPIYPGAALQRGNDEGGLDVNGSASGKTPVRFVVAKYRSKDSAPKVIAFYKKRLGKEVTKFTEKADDGSTVFEIKQKMEQRVVSVKSVEGETEIDLIHIEGLENDAK
jgi:hypothetical protein